MDNYTVYRHLCKCLQQYPCTLVLYTHPGVPQDAPSEAAGTGDGSGQAADAAQRTEEGTSPARAAGRGAARAEAHQNSAHPAGGTAAATAAGSIAFSDTPHTAVGSIAFFLSLCVCVCVCVCVWWGNGQCCMLHFFLTYVQFGLQSCDVYTS